jgi:hypothetical protein
VAGGWRLLVVLVAVLGGCLGVGVAPVFAGSAWWHVLSTARPTFLAAGGEGRVVATVVNFGDATTATENAKGEPTPVRIVDRLPAGLKAVEGAEGIEAWRPEGKHLVPVSGCRLESLGAGEPLAAVCELEAGVVPFDAIEVRVLVRVQPGADTGELNRVSVSGGGAPELSVARPVTIASSALERTPFGVEDFEVDPEEEGGGTDTQAGSYPFQTTFTLDLNQGPQVLTPAGLTSVDPAGVARDVNVKFPPGLIGNPQPLARCTSAEFLAKVNECPVGSVVGVAVVTVNEPDVLGVIPFTVPVFNLEPTAGEPARFGFLPENYETPVYIDTSVRTGGDYGIVSEVHNVPQTIGFLTNTVTIWGVPGDVRHDPTRDGCLESHSGNYPCEPSFSQSSPPPFFELPTSCLGPLQAGVELDSWEEPGVFKSYGPSEPLPAMDGCDRLPFDPSLEVHPDVADASTATGLTVNVKVPQEESLNAKGLGEADIRDTTVTLPEGVAVNPAGGDGLQACPNALVGYQERFEEPPLQPGSSVPVFTAHLPGSIGALRAGEGAPLEPGIDFCADASKVATVRLKVAVLKKELTGAVYLGAQEANPFGSLIAMYIVAEDPESGVLVKLPGEVSLNPQTGQLVATFSNTPQAPAEEIELHFFGGERAPLATPAHCGSYTTMTSITPWSDPESGPPATPSSTFQITSGPNGGACPAAALPFNASLTAGMTSIQAGGFSPFTMTMSREDGSQHLQAIQLKLPEGLEGLLANVELCPEPQAGQGLCGPGSLIGETTVSVGVGGHPYTVAGGRVYITGPYKGAPFGLSIVNPAKAGPYDLANTRNNHPGCDCVLVRAKLEFNPLTAQVTVTSDPSGPTAIPTILEGIPLQIQHVNVTITRPGFTVNPTSCEKLSIGGTLQSAEGATQNLAVPFQAANCQNLGFTPKITVSTKAQASKVNGAGLLFKISYPKGALGTQAWLQEVKFDFPKQLPARLETLQQACLAHVFETNRPACPKASIIGHATVHTQALPVPLTGPVYFVSYGSKKFPEAVIVLEGYGITLESHGETFINNKTGVTSATFHNIPDAPFETLEVTIPTGRYSEFAANLPPKDHYNLCGQKLNIPTLLKAQNGQQTNQTTPITITGCKPKPHNTHKHKKTHKKHK